MVNWTLWIGALGAITGVVSLGWHMLNSRSKVILERVSFTRDSQRDRSQTEAIKFNIIIRNKGNRSTTIENVYLLIGNRNLPVEMFNKNRHINANSSWTFEGFEDFRADEFKDIIKNIKREEIRLGVKVAHTFGMLKKVGYTDFSTDWLNL